MAALQDKSHVCRIDPAGVRILAEFVVAQSGRSGVVRIDPAAELATLLLPNLSLRLAVPVPSVLVPMTVGRTAVEAPPGRSCVGRTDRDVVDKPGTAGIGADTDGRGEDTVEDTG